MLATSNCPSCLHPMEAHRFATRNGGHVELDICFGCQGLWFDPNENTQLAPDAVLELFELLHRHRADAHAPLSDTLRCPRCRSVLSRGFDVVKSGRYVTYRCAKAHGRFATFSSFMVEKGFVRQMTRPEIEDLARRVDAIFCTGCGAPVDIRKDHACPHCRAPFSLLDPAAVEQALQRHSSAAAKPGAQPSRSADLADALMAIERDRANAQREERKERLDLTTDLWSAGIEMVWRVLAR
ncbi:zf-TFIIB domain-containing protein [Variovorax dokdonensis]|uniref:Zf-TFIIB domain-containing protein n=1 Tax=Variovorax dokdonensis TaxID=344883 RepID=A0ABT7NEA0_9BURK|nr:zf-TFIIB domain-containing protein [Variovorax dokdonensis]